MATSSKAFNQVKSILSKLDQRIDSLRQQRTGHDTPESVLNQTIGRGGVPQPLAPAALSSSPGTHPVASHQPPERPAPAAPALGPGTVVGAGSAGKSAGVNGAHGRSAYGRATPIRPARPA
ncbi:MAG: hypothetical protein C0475_03580 [Planctomyces sp.]|nr:hypothetical protein [Planctomyces sp.]MBA4039151.1 hypothetical protein [Planctomyces sp.]MBA4119555.1 hypothetical protein [Isosphaera sp.]